jgi:transcriptional regulator with XRE-family HTH domain
VPAAKVRLPRGRPLSPKEPVPAAVITFGHRLRVWRMTAGLTQTQLAERVGVLPPIISLIESGQREPVWRLVLTLADALGVSTEDFREKPGATVLPPPQRTPATFAEMLTAKRVAAGLSQSEVARRAGVTSAALSRYELGQRRPTAAVVSKLATALGCSVEQLGEGSDPASRSGEPAPTGKKKATRTGK